MAKHRSASIRTAATVGALSVALTMLFAACASVRRTPDTPHDQNSIVGVWQLVREEVWELDSAKLIESLTSDRSAGLLIYHADGQMSVQIDRRAWAPNWPYLAYYGPYSVDATTSTIDHHVVASTNDYRGTVQRRRFSLDATGERLMLFTDLGGTPAREARLTWRRISRHRLSRR